MANTIRIQTDARVKEGVASGSVTPGHLLERTSTADTVKVHATAGGVNNRLFAVENGWEGDEMDTAYATTEKVFFIRPAAGDVVYARIANGEAVAIHSLLVSNGDGTLKIHTPDSSGTIVEEDIVGEALEACDMSDSSAADPAAKCKVEIW